MTATAYRFHSIEADGPWTSPPFSPADRRHIVQGVLGGFIMGRPRWAEDLDGNFIYGLDAKGKEVTTAPTYTPEPTPRRRGKNKPKPKGAASHTTRKKSPAQLDREIAEALSRSPGSTAHATRRAALPDRYEVVETVDGDWMVLIDGVQTGSDRDRSGAGSDTYPTRAAAYAAALDLSGGSKGNHITHRRSHATAGGGFDPSKLLVGQRFDHLGHIYEITKIGRDKARTVQIARRSRDSFGKEFLIDHRSFPARAFDRQHLRPI